MSITITVAFSLPEHFYQRVVDVARQLQSTDINFEGVPIAVQRGETSSVCHQVTISDQEDTLRENLLRLLLESAVPEVQVDVPNTAAKTQE